MKKLRCTSAERSALEDMFSEHGTCWYNLKSRKALEDSKGHTTKSPLATNKTAAWRHAWLRLWRSGSCVIDSVELRRGRDPEGMGRMVICIRERRARARERE